MTLSYRRDRHQAGWLAGLLLALLLAVPGQAFAARDIFLSISAPGTRSLSVSKGQSLTVTTKEPVMELVVGDSEIADITPLTDRSFYIMGRTYGRTNIVAYDAQGRAIGVIDVEVTADIEDLRRSLRQLLPGANLKVRSINGQIHLSGSVPDAVMAERAVRIAREYGADSVINAISVSGSQQVMLEVRFVETSRIAGRELGVSWGAFGRRQTSVTGSVLFPDPKDPDVIPFKGLLPSGAEPFGTMFARLLNGGVAVDVLIQALEQRGLARRLAEPNLIALSGQTASFLAGGEVPVPTVRQSGEVAVEYKEYGIQLEFTPVVLENGLINLRLEPEVSQVDFSTMVRTGGVDVPGFTSRRALSVAGQPQAEPAAVDRQCADSRGAVPFAVLPARGNGSGHHRDAAPRSPGRSGHGAGDAA